MGPFEWWGKGLGGWFEYFGRRVGLWLACEVGGRRDVDLLGGGSLVPWGCGGPESDAVDIVVE